VIEKIWETSWSRFGYHDIGSKWKKTQLIVSGKETAAKEKLIEKHGNNGEGECLSRLNFVSCGLSVTKLAALKKQVVFDEYVVS